MAKNEIQPDKLYWASFNRFEMRVLGEAVTDCAHQGNCEADVKNWAPKIAAQVEADNFTLKPTPEKIRAALKEYGAWDEAELQDDAQNWIRLCWIACCNISEYEKPDCSDPVKD